MKEENPVAIAVACPSGLRRGLLLVLNATLHVVHCVLMAFSVFGWMFAATRWATLWVLLLIAFSWYGIGAYMGIGYCLVTDMQWRVKRALGETPPPNGYVKYLADRITGGDVSETFTHVLTVSVFFVSLVACVWLLLRQA
jgi:hypothetical protein